MKAKMKAKLNTHRIEEEWRIRMDDILRACKIPTSHIHGLSVEQDEDYESDDDDEDEESIEVLVIKIRRESKTDRAKKRR